MRKMVFVPIHVKMTMSKPRIHQYFSDYFLYPFLYPFVTKKVLFPTLSLSQAKVLDRKRKPLKTAYLLALRGVF